MEYIILNTNNSAY